MTSEYGSNALNHQGENSSFDHGRREDTHAASDESSLDLVQVSGHIKWFDVAKGFGFIVPDNGLPDILLHVTCLRRDGYQAANEGARIVVEAVQRPRAGSGQVVQPPARLRLPDPGRGQARHLRPYGNPAALRHRRAEARRAGLCALWRRLQRPDGGRGAPRRHVPAALPLTSRSVLRPMRAV